MTGSVFQALARRLKAARSRYGNFTYRFSHAISVGAGILYVASLISAVLCLVVLVVIGGYEHSPGDLARLTGLLHLFQGIFIVDILYNLVLRLRSTLRSGRVVMMIVDGAMLLTLIPLLYPRPENPWLPWLSSILYSRYFVYMVLCGYSIVEVSFGLMSVTRRRTNPSLLLSCSFLFFILAGSFVLMLPRFTVEPISYIDSLFVATSAVCITGLTPVDIAATFTPAGYIVLCVLFQVGALGVLTFTCFFAIFFSGATSVYNQLLVRDMIYSKTMNALVPTLLYIMTFTLAIEAVGAVAVYFTAPPALFADNGQRIMFAVFHAMSSFCNVGFSCLPDGMSNPALMTATQSVYSVTSLLVIAGGIGFPILVNLKDIIVLKFKNLWHRLRHLPVERRVHIYDLNTKLVLVTYFGILAFASLAFFFLEYDNTLRGMTLWHKVVQSVFNSLVPRSAGFSSVNPAGFLPITLLLVVVQMWIGGGSQSLAGGIKVNTVAAVLLNMRSILRGGSRPWAYDRSISVGTIRRANSVVLLSIIAFIILSAILLMCEPALSPRALLFEAVSALFTVGSSLGITSSLGFVSKVAVCVAMFVGRVGIISLLTGLIRPRTDISEHLPQENLIIN